MTGIEVIILTIIGLVHIYILVLEMFLWEKPTGLRVFGHTAEQAKITSIMAANQGLYNGFLAAGIFWGIFLGPNGFAVKIFFLTCILIAGLYGGYTALRKIYYVQALPAVVGLIVVFLANS